MKQTLNQRLAEPTFERVRHGMTGMVAEVVGMRGDKMVLKIVENPRMPGNHIGECWVQSKAEMDLFWF